LTRLANRIPLAQFAGEKAVSRRQYAAGRRAWPGLALICALAAPLAAHAQSEAVTYRVATDILALFPNDTGTLEHGVRVRLANGAWLEIGDNPFGKTAPELCWYAPSLHVAGVCQSAPGVNVVVLIDLRSGRRVTAPGLPRLMPEPGLIAVGPDEARGVPSDSVTLVKVAPNDLIDEGGALFDEDYGPGGWVDGDCYRLSGKGGKAGGWLERAASGWRQTPAAQSTLCQGRHAR
jgi:hypothetical protein